MFLWILLLSALNAWSAPQEIEVWFVSPPATAQWSHLLSPQLQNENLIVQACEPVGDYCFDPKIGLYSRKVEIKEETKEIAIDEGLPQLPTATSINRSLVNCDAKYAFDIFCGKAQPDVKPSGKAELEVWIDVSSSMRAMDAGDGKGSCHRAKLYESLKSTCKKSPVIKGFDTSIRDLGSAAGACVNQGMNDAKRLIHWMEESTAKKLLLITDVYEYQAELSQYLESKNAKIRGDRGTFPAAQMLDFISDLAKSCE